MAQIIEFKNQRKEVLRGILDEAPKSKGGVIFAHGFERTTIEYKFKNIVDSLRDKINLFRFDFSGCGLSSGSFEDMTVGKSVQEFILAVKAFKKHCPQVGKINIIAHSLGACVAAESIKNKRLTEIKKIVLLAPALNQRELLRYWFVKNHFRHELEINWDNFRQHLTEGEFQNSLQEKRHMTREHYLLNDYYLESEGVDYNEMLINSGIDGQNILVVHGRHDERVPPESNKELLREAQLSLVEGGDHDLQRPDMVEQYLNQVVKFILTD